MKKTFLTLMTIAAIFTTSNVLAQDVTDGPEVTRKIEKAKQKTEKKKQNIDQKLAENLDKIKRNAHNDTEKAKIKAEQDKKNADVDLEIEIQKIRFEAEKKSIAEKKE